MASISIGGNSFCPGHNNTEWNDYPAIASWLERIISLENRVAPEVIVPTGSQAA